MSDTKKVTRHLQSAKRWLEEAEDRFQAEDVVKGELTLSLVLAEVRHAWEVSRGVASCAMGKQVEEKVVPQARRGVLFGGLAKAALLTAVLVGLLWIGQVTPVFSPAPPVPSPAVVREGEARGVETAGSLPAVVTTGQQAAEQTLVEKELVKEVAEKDSSLPVPDPGPATVSAPAATSPGPVAAASPATSLGTAPATAATAPEVATPVATAAPVAEVPLEKEPADGRDNEENAMPLLEIDLDHLIKLAESSLRQVASGQVVK